MLNMDLDGDERLREHCGKRKQFLFALVELLLLLFREDFAHQVGSLGEDPAPSNFSRNAL